RRKINLEEINTPQSAINVSLAEFGYVNTLFLEQRIGSDWKEQTADYLFRIPGTEKYELREIYLSGDVKTKLEEAEKYLSEDRTIQKNVEELKKVIPADIPAEQISIRLGNRWIPDQMYGEFFRELLQNNSGSIKVSYSGSEADT
ncbi:MAG TPA: hypothetical protein PLB70_00940, partial [Paludibacteraceae bacterium]|nr:hypothetical protein [Paludibacteraceae bacterium]